MNHFNWQDEYKIDHDVIDAHHQQLFDLANSIMTVTDHAEITRMLMLFYQHIRVHFAAEERFMKESNYPDYQKHIETHNKMLDRLVDISKSVHAKRWQNSDIQAFVNHWVLEHILTEDMKVVHHLKSNES